MYYGENVGYRVEGRIGVGFGMFCMIGVWFYVWWGGRERFKYGSKIVGFVFFVDYVGGNVEDGFMLNIE